MGHLAPDPTAKTNPVLLARSAVARAHRAGDRSSIEDAYGRLAVARIEREIRAALANPKVRMSGDDRRRLARLLTIGAPDA
jgi:hypothetical protein